MSAAHDCKHNTAVVCPLQRIVVRQFFMQFA